MINFLKHKTWYLALSTFVILSGIVSIATMGYAYSVDFVGGSTIQYQLDKTVSAQAVQQALRSYQSKTKQVSVKEKIVTVRVDMMQDGREQSVRKLLTDKLGVKATLLQSQTVGPTLGRETVYKMLIATAFATIAIFGYITFAFKGVHFAIAAIVALVHDVLVMLGVYSIVARIGGGEFDTLFVTALLTTMSFSVHDTIVIFDKIREYKRTFGSGDVQQYANRALTQTLIRSVNNSMTIIFMLLALALIGGSTIRFFVIALLIGTITGTYSSPFVATPVWVWLTNLAQKRSKKS